MTTLKTLTEQIDVTNVVAYIKDNYHIEIHAKEMDEFVEILNDYYAGFIEEMVYAWVERDIENNPLPVTGGEDISVEDIPF